MIRFILLAILFYVLWRLVFGPPFRVDFLLKGGRKKQKKPRHPEAEEMVRCAACGTFISKREAEEGAGLFHCKPKCH